MNKKIVNTIRLFTKPLLLSLVLHLAFGATSYALWYAMKAIPLSSNKLQKAAFLTASVEFLPDPSTQSNPILPNTRKIANTQQKTHQISQQKANLYNTAISHQKDNGSSLSDIVPNPENKYPTYPEEARLIGKEALCIMKISVAANGTIHQVKLESNTESCPNIFMREAKKTILTWRFSPHRSGYIERIVPIKFKLD